jgi:hypothetical protein
VREAAANLIATLLSENETIQKDSLESDWIGTLVDCLLHEDDVDVSGAILVTLRSVSSGQFAIRSFLTGL